MIRTYTELMEIPDYLDRYRYLKIGGRVGEETFGADRWFNQRFYNSSEWRDIRREVLVRDMGRDLAHPDYEIGNLDSIVIHHMNPVTIDDIRNHTDYLMDPEYLIACSLNTHNAIHYGDESLIVVPSFVVRRANDTCLWR